MDFIFDPSLVLYLPLYELDGVSFMSKDAYGHLCSVTGALWRPNGHYFDGIDDKIACGNSTAFDSAGITIEMWIKLGSLAATARYLYSKGAVVGSFIADINISQLQRVQIKDASGWKNTISSLTAIATTTDWHHCAFTFKQPSLVFYMDLEREEVTFNWAITANTANLDIAQGRGGYWIGNIGEVRLYSRALTPQEIQHNYLATKWRYR